MYTLSELANLKLIWSYDPIELLNVDGFHVYKDNVLQFSVPSATMEYNLINFGINVDDTYLLEVAAYNAVGVGPRAGATLVVDSGVAPVTAPVNMQIVPI